MDLQLYYQKIRETETKIADEFALVVSLETSDGGKSGTEDGGAAPAGCQAAGGGPGPAGDEGRGESVSRVAGGGACELAERAAAAAKLQLTVLSTNELDRLRSDARGIKE